MEKRAVWLLASWLLACGNPTTQGAVARRDTGSQAEAPVVTPPFAVRGEARGLLLVWYDPQGKAHTARERSEIPAAQRGQVRVDSLTLPPDERLDPAFVYVADLRQAKPDGTYPVRKMRRGAFAKAVAPAAPADDSPALGGDAAVVIYGASWCGACKQAARYFRDKGIPFVEKDIEKEPEARQEMLAKARKQGINPSGIPVIDVRGTLVGGFNPARVERLLAQK